MYNYGRRSSSLLSGPIAIIAVFAIIIAIALSPFYYATKEYTVTVTDKAVKNYSGSSTYLVFTELENGESQVFKIENSLIKRRFNSSDVYGQIKIDKTYKIEVIGFRIPFLSQYQNIMTFTELKVL